MKRSKWQEKTDQSRAIKLIRQIVSNLYVGLKTYRQGNLPERAPKG